VNARLVLPIALAPIACAVAAGSQAVAAPDVETFVLAVGGQSQPSFPDPPPFACATYGTPQPVFDFFGGLGVSMPIEGYAQCSIAGGYKSQSAATGPLTDSTSLDVDYHNFDNDHSSGSADARADFGSIGARAYARFIGPSGNSQIVQGAESFGKFRDTFTITSVAVTSGASGYVRFHFWIDGSLSFAGNDDVRMTVDYQQSGGPTYPLMITGSNVAGPTAFISYPAGFGSANGPGVYGGFTLTTSSSSGAGEFDTFLLPIVFGTPFDLTVGLMADVLPGANLDGVVDFLATARLSGIEVMDGGMTPVATFSVASGSGTSYDASGVHLPQDPTRPVVSSGAPVPGGTGFLTSFAQGPESSGGRDAFIGLGTAGQAGVYVRDAGSSAYPVDPCKVADLATAIPGGVGAFTGFTNLSLTSAIASGNPSPVVRVGFVGAGVGQQGIYAADVSDLQHPTDPCRVADLSSTIPGGDGTFTGFGDLSLTALPVAQPQSPPIRAGFLGSGNGQQGVYLADVSDLQVPPSPIKVADLATAVPGGTDNFTSFSEVSLTTSPFGSAGSSSSRFGFIGSGTGQQGIYLADVSDLQTPPDPIRVADLNTLVPSGSGALTGFSHLSLASAPVAAPAAWPTRIAFLATGAGQQGVYLTELSGLLIPPDPIRLADLTTSIPGGTGAFTGFGAVSAGANQTAFEGYGSGGQAGIYLASPVTKVVAIGDALEGSIVTGLSLGREGLNGNQLDFAVTLADGSQELLAYTVPSLADAAGAGSVGDSLHIDRSIVTPGNIRLTWGSSCSAAAVDYAIYEGQLGVWYSHVMRTCTDVGSDLSEELAPSAGSRYYLVVPLGADGEGSYGKDSKGAERPLGAGARCATVQSLGPCP
jgi:hypothetical protein